MAPEGSQGSNGAEEARGGGVGAEKFYVAGQAGAVGEQMAEGDAAGVGVVAADDEAWEQGANQSVGVEQAALVEQHGGGRGGGDFGDAGDVEDGVG